jgi:hypothetical protein
MSNRIDGAPLRKRNLDYVRALIVVTALIGAVVILAGNHLHVIILANPSQTSSLRTEANEPSFVSILVNKYQHSTKPSNYDWKLQLYARLDQVKQKCGILCSFNSPESVIPYQVAVPGWDHWKMIRVGDWGVNHRLCETFIAMEEVDASDASFPEEIPLELRPVYTFNNSIKIRPNGTFYRQAYLDSRTITWSKEMIDDMIQKARAGTLKGTYRLSTSQRLQAKLQQLPIQDARVMVIGSENPWVEVICLSLGAAHVATLEYSTIISLHPKLSTFTPKAFRQLYLDGTLELFDVIVTHSSIEHSGLGRYGDALNPWGDMLALARAWCVTKPNGFLYLGVPTGVDKVVYNAHRVYGKIRYPLVTVNWKPLVPDSNNLLESSSSTEARGRRANITIASDGSEFELTRYCADCGYLFQKVL